MHLIGIPGSLRDGSYNRLLLEAAADLAPDGVTLEIAPVGDLPLYDEDLDAAMGGGPEPAAVTRFKDRVGSADALLIATPEYNWSIPGPLKNAIDWVSRPAGRSPLRGKPAALIGVSPGPAGTGRAQLHLREVLLSTRTPVLMTAVQVPHGRERFDAEGRLTDEDTRSALRTLLDELAQAVPAERRAAPVA